MAGVRTIAGRFISVCLVQGGFAVFATTFVILFANGMGTYETAYALSSSNVNLLTIRIAALVSGDVFAKPNLGSALAVALGVLLVTAMLIIQKKGKVVQT